MQVKAQATKDAQVKAIAANISIAVIASIISLSGLFRIGEITGHYLQDPDCYQNLPHKSLNLNSDA